MAARRYGRQVLITRGGSIMAGHAFGVIGLEVMGRNIALNIERNGFPVAVFNRT